MLYFNEPRDEPGEGYCCWSASDRVPVVKIESLEWKKGFDTNLDLDTCDNNGGKRIFPGALTPTDSHSYYRRRVYLVATVDPPIPGIDVYFRIFDVDDPFDQDNANMVNVEVIDNDTEGADNREYDPYVDGKTRWAITDQCGQAALFIEEVSMQPGNNYRAGASLMNNATQQETMYNGETVTPQEHADALNANGGDWSGYSCPLYWSKMLTVWRKLHVERDTMAAPGVGTNQVVGIVTGITPNSPAPGQSVIELGQNLADEFSDLNLYEGGTIDFAACPRGMSTFDVLLSTSNYVSDDTVTINGVPGPCANGSVYILRDDDDPAVLPHFPSFGQLGVDAFAKAYILPVDAGPTFQSTVAFNMQMSDNEVTTGLGWNNGDNIDSSTAFWSCLVVGAWEPAQNFDYDPDPCPPPAVPEADSKETGVTVDEWGQSLIYMQVLADDAACTFATDEVHTVTHEIGHSCGQHKQPWVPTADENGHVYGTIMQEGAPRHEHSFGSDPLKVFREQDAW